MLSSYEIVTISNLQYSIFVLILSVLSAFLVRYIFESFLNSLSRKTKAKLDDKIVKVLKTPIFWSVFLTGIYFFLLTLKISGDFENITLNILTSIGIILWSIATIQILKLLLRAYDDTHIEGRLSDAIPFLENFIIIIVSGTAALLALDTWGINITPLLASAGVVGIAVAFAAKDTVSNLFGGVSVFLDKPYKVGDYVIIREHYRGEVIEIGMRSTKIRTRDNILISVPNSVMVTDAVINETGFDPKLRIHIPLGVAYDTDLDKAEYVLLNVLQAQKSLLKEPAPRIRYRNFGKSSIELEALAVIDKPANKGRITHQLIKEITKAFREEKIQIPFPQQDVYLHKSS